MAPVASKMMVLGLAVSASAFSPINPSARSTALFNGPVIGAGGMADTRDPDALTHEDPRKSISEAPSFEEYLKQRAGGAAPAPAPVAAPAPAPVAAWSPPVAAPAPAPAAHAGPVIGAGGMADTRDPDALTHEDPRKSISVAPSFEEYMKQRDGAAAAPAAAAPVAAAPAAAAPAAWAPPAAAAPAVGGGGSVVDVLATLEGPGVVWGAEGVEMGKEESELKGLDNFGKFYQALQSTGVAAELAAGGPYTVFAPTDSALETYEQLRGPIDANVVKMHIVPGQIASADITGDLQSLAGPLHYRYAVRKHFINDAIIGEKSFGPYPDFPVDVAAGNGVIHAVGLCFALY